MFEIYDPTNKNDSGVIKDSGRLEFRNALMKKWDELHKEPGVFRYQIDILNERFINQKYLIQLNTNRGTKRRMPENIKNIVEPFDDKKFNFTKVSNKEIMFTLIKDKNESDRHAILVNVSPINCYHSLLCPLIDKQLPQVVTAESLTLALEVMLYIEDRSLKVGFNSLCALASVNHLHYHLFIEHRMLAVEVAKRKQIKGTLYILEDYVVPTFCFDVNEDVDKTTQDIFKLLSYLLDKYIAHNIFMSWGKGSEEDKDGVSEADKDRIRVFVWPRKSCAGVKNLAAFNVAVCELAGWFPVYDAVEFERLQSEDLEKELSKWKYEEFSELCEELKSLF